MQTKQTEISQKQSEQTKIFKISYYIISEVLMNEMIKRIEVRCTLRTANQDRVTANSHPRLIRAYVLESKYSGVSRSTVI